MPDTASMILARVRRLHAEWVAPVVHRERHPVAIETWHAPGEPVPFDAARDAAYLPFDAGTPWGRPWGTTWFRLTGTVPSSWAPDCARELLVDLGWIGSGPGFQAEGLVYDPSGVVLKGLEPRNTWLPVSASPGEDFCLYVEAAANPDVSQGWSFRPTPLGDLATAPDEPLYTFRSADLAVRDDEVFALERDLWLLLDLVPQLPEHSVRRAALLLALERAADLIDPGNVAGSATSAREQLAPALASPAATSSHHAFGVGHAHIDSAWLWPVRETRRKVARTFANVLALMDRYPDMVFAASSAQQYAWLKQDHPALFERVRERIAVGRFVAVGGMWVESDTNLPGGEAMARQFILGKEFFLREFGVETDEVWLPDSFGYSAALPQIVAASNTSNFLTQKISWNETNVMPHHTFSWEGIDGTRVFTHFPPVDTYNAEFTAAELARAERQHSEAGRSDVSLVPFGHGDGGGGPTREMVETARRKADLEGSPRVSIERPDTFFAAARESLPDPAVWVGELYLEFHRGTYTSQARTKLGNRRCEHLLRETELWCATAAVRTEFAYPAAELQECWEIVLLQQFHDILPGSSIAWVYEVAERNYAEVESTLERLIGSALTALDGVEEVWANATPVSIDDVPALSAAASCSAGGYVGSSEDEFVITTEHFFAIIDQNGRISSLVDLATERDVIPSGTFGNELLFYRDLPTQWDAWDVDRSYQRMPLDAVRATSSQLADRGVLVTHRVGTSTVRQWISPSPDGRALDIETTVDWHEQQKLLKLGFPIDVHTTEAAFEVQFGHVRRPTHTNTSWDSARFEVSGHRWVRVEEPGFGVTLANDRVYGRDVTRHARDGGGTYSLIRESLLRAPRFPDPEADQGEHVFRHSLRIGSLLDGVAEGYRLNLPLRPAAGPIDPLVHIEGSPAIMVEAVKLAQDGSGDVIVRLYEAAGGRATGRLVPSFASTDATRTDLLERPWPDQPGDALNLDLRPFELVTVRIARA